jgi:hypothetical protein
VGAAALPAPAPFFGSFFGMQRTADGNRLTFHRGNKGSPGRSGLPFCSFALRAKSVQIAERYRFPSLEARADAQVAGKSIRT